MQFIGDQKAQNAGTVKKTALNLEAILLNDFKGNGASMELINVPTNHKLSFLLFDNDFSIFTEGKDLQPLDFKISSHSDRICSVLCFTQQNRRKKSFTWQIKIWAKNSHPADKKKWAKIYPAVGSEEVALADVLATASYSLEDRSDFLVKVLS